MEKCVAYLLMVAAVAAIAWAADGLLDRVAARVNRATGRTSAIYEMGR